MEITVKVNRIIRTPKVSKQGKEYKIFAIIGNDDNYYSLYENKENMAELSKIKEGQIISMEIENGRKPGYFNILKITVLRDEENNMEGEDIYTKILLERFRIAKRALLIAEPDAENYPEAYYDLLAKGMDTIRAEAYIQHEKWKISNKYRT